MKIFLTFLFLLLPITSVAGEEQIIRLKNGDVLENATLEGNVGIIIEGDADVTIANCIIDTQKKIAIQALPGSGSVTIRGSKITSQNGKGLYIQPERKIFISNCDITACKEEGLDIRENVKGFVTGCQLSNNGEGGIELVAGSTDLEIKNNIFENNTASGLAIQFYSYANQEGKITLSENSFRNNHKFGIDCLISEGIRPQAQYWIQSIDLADNKFTDNNLGTVNKACNYTGPIDDGDKKMLAEVARNFESANVPLGNNSDGLWQKIKNVWYFLINILGTNE